MTHARSLLQSAAALFLAGAAAAQAPFPGSQPGVDIGGGFAPEYEASGAVWHPRLQQLFVVSDDGHLTRMNANGAIVQSWTVAGDLEGICVADPNTNFVYIGNENPDSVIEFNFVTGQVTRTFNLTATMTGPANEGLEALTFVPDAANPEGGRFHAGLQADGRVFVYQLPIQTSATSTSVAFVNTYTPVPGRDDIADLAFDNGSQRIYALYDSANRITQLTKAGAFLQEWVIPGDNQEGIALRGCQLFVAQDQTTERFLVYGGFPMGSACELLSQDTAQISLTMGGTANFALHAPSSQLAGVTYVLLGSASGTTPGFDISPAHIPLNPDWYTELIVDQYNTPTFVNTVGTFSASLTAVAKLVVPTGLSPVLIGTELSHAWIAVNVAAGELGPVSNPITLTLEF